MKIKTQAVYISGPVTGIANGNRDAFFDMEERLNKWADGADYEDADGSWMPVKLEVINPQAIAREVEYEKRYQREPPSWEDYMRACVRELCRADRIVYLPGVERSRGGRLEREIAGQLGIEEFPISLLPDMPDDDDDDDEEPFR